MSKVIWRDKTGRDLVNGQVVVEVDDNNKVIRTYSNIVPYGDPILHDNGSKERMQVEGTVTEDGKTKQVVVATNRVIVKPV